MAVYVDNARNPYGRMLMNHMIADTLPELHAMADAIGVQRKWFQSKASFPHYDVCEAKRTKALALGATAVSRSELGAHMKRIREQMKGAHVA